MEVTLKTPIKPGFRRAFSVSTDEPVDKNSDGAYATGETLEGDSTPPTINPESTATQITGWVNGDGATGNKKARIKADGHVGEGEVAITLDVFYEVASPDATSFTNFQEGGVPDEPIPTT